MGGHQWLGRARQAGLDRHFELGRALCVGLSLAVCVVRADGQAVERPAAFDSAGRVRAIAPSLAARMALAAPEWPVVGNYVEARLYVTQEPGGVIVVERPDGSVERFALDASALASLMGAVNAGVTRAGNVVGEGAPTAISEPAGGSFLRKQMLATAFVYAPALAVLADDPSVAGTLYFGAIGASYFVLASLANSQPITRAQSDLASDGAWRWSTAAAVVVDAMGGDGENEKAIAFARLGGGIAGSVVGYRMGRGWTDGEVKAATAMSNHAALTTLGVLGAGGALRDDKSKAIALTVVGGGTLGYVLGPRYARRSKYTVTAGDISMVGWAGVLGAAVAASPTLVPDNPDARTVWTAATAGYLGGLLAGDRLFSRRYDYSRRDATMVGLGTIAGAALGMAAIAGSDDINGGVAVAAVAGGGIIGTGVAQSIIKPAKEGASRIQRLGSATRGRSRVGVSGMGLLAAASGRPGKHKLVTIRF